MKGNSKDRRRYMRAHPNEVFAKVDGKWVRATKDGRPIVQIKASPKPQVPPDISHLYGDEPRALSPMQEAFAILAKAMHPEVPQAWDMGIQEHIIRSCGIHPHYIDCETVPRNKSSSAAAWARRLAGGDPK